MSDSHTVMSSKRIISSLSDEARAEMEALIRS